MPIFRGEEDDDGIDPKEWLRIMKESDRTPLSKIYLDGEANKWWSGIDMDIKHTITWKAFEELFSNKWTME